MKEFYRSGVTPQQKLVGVNNKFGNTDIKFQQGTTRCLYDTLPLTTAAQSFRFFEDSASRVFPFSNTGSDGNKLGVGETMVIEQIAFLIMTYDEDLKRYTTFTNTSLLLNDAKYDIVLANNTVVKDFQVVAQNSRFNDTPGAEQSTWYTFDTLIVIPPLLNFQVNVQLGNAGAPGANLYLRCLLFGSAGILAPRTTF